MIIRFDRRTLLAAGLMAPMFALMMAVMGCLPVPVGDPENSTPDAALNGAWIMRDDDKEDLYIVQSYDKHTHLVRNYKFKRDGERIETGDVAAYKAWITKISGVDFITIEPMPLAASWGEKTDKPTWVVGKYQIDGPTLKFTMVKADADLIKNATTRQEAEAVIAANANNASLFIDSVPMRKASQDEARELLGAFKAQ